MSAPSRLGHSVPPAGSGDVSSIAPGPSSRAEGARKPQSRQVGSSAALLRPNRLLQSSLPPPRRKRRANTEDASIASAQLRAELSHSSNEAVKARKAKSRYIGIRRQRTKCGPATSTLPLPLTGSSMWPSLRLDTCSRCSGRLPKGSGRWTHPSWLFACGQLVFLYHTSFSPR